MGISVSEIIVHPYLNFELVSDWFKSMSRGMIAGLSFDIATAYTFTQGSSVVWCTECCKHDEVVSRESQECRKSYWKPNCKLNSLKRLLGCGGKSYKFITFSV